MTPEDQLFLEEEVWTVISPEEDIRNMRREKAKLQRRDYRAREKEGKVIKRADNSREHQTLVKIIVYPDVTGLDYERVITQFPFSEKEMVVQVESAIDDLKDEMVGRIKKKKGVHWGFNGTR